jgi:alginate O-acetyltransferase complex protein AlgJ
METHTDRRQARRRLTRLFPEPGRSQAEGISDDSSRGILATEISPRLAQAITIAFVAAILVIPITQAAGEVRRGKAIQALDIFRRIPTRENLAGFESELARLSYARQSIRPRLQLGLSDVLGVGTATAIVGRDGWLFYRPGIDWISGPGLLDPARLAQRRKELKDAGEPDASPDPRPAIRALHEECRRAGVHLVVVPVPDKVTLEADRLTSRFDRDAADRPTNVDFRRFVDELRSSGIDVFDPTPDPADPEDPDRFLQQDTHWTPEWMEDVARGLAEHLKQNVTSLRAPTAAWRAVTADVSRVGDIVDLLQLPEGQQLYPPQTVTIHRVLDSSGQEWRPREEADILLLGDSLSNIYGTPDLGWGEAAGLPAQLARFLGRDVDILARNGSGATAIRRELARRQAPLEGKAVMVWEFAARELMLGNWEVVPMPTARRAVLADRSSHGDGSRTSPLVLESTVVAGSHVPRPFTVPYKDCLTYIKLRVDRVVQGSYSDGQVIAVFWGMKDNIRQPAADYPAGIRLRLELTPLRKARASLGSARSADDLEDIEHQPYFVLKESAVWPAGGGPGSR